MESNDSDVEFVSHEVVGSSISKRKKTLSSTDKSLKCKTCGKTFSDYRDRRKHEQIHLPGFPYSCNICTYRGKTRHYLVRHVKKVHGERSVKCDFCPAVFTYKCKMEEHMRVHTGEKPYKCEHCPKTFRVPYTLKCHMLTHTDEKPFECSFCDYACKDSSTLRKHQNKHLGLVKLFNCSICNKSFKHKWRLKIHISESHLQMDLKKHKCDQCGKMFKSLSHVTLHTKIVHDRVYATKCPVCGVKVSNRYNLRFHLTTHVDYRPYICTQSGCNKAFKDRSALKKHTIIHKPELHYPCKLCDMKFGRKHRLLMHLKQHEDRKRNIICDYCLDSFYSKNYLIKHIKQKHTDTQTYICDECGMKTKTKTGMVTHFKYGHRNKNDRECKICHTKYKRFEYLKNHYYRTHNVRYKMVKPFGKKRPKPCVRDLEAEVKVKMEPVDEEFDQIDLLDVDKEEIQDDCLEYSQSVLNEDIQACILKSKGNSGEIEFDQFLVTHMFKKTKEEVDNIPEDVNPIELQKSNAAIDELLKKSEKSRLKREKRNKLKALAKSKERKVKMEAKMLEEKKKEEQHKMIRDEKYLARIVQEEINEFKNLIDKYNERMKVVSSNVFKKKECTKIQYFKAKTNQSTNDNNDLVEEENDDISFAVKPSKNYIKYGDNIKINSKNDNINYLDKENEEFSNDNERLVKNNNENGESIEMNDELATNNSDIDENGQNYKVNDNHCETNKVNDEKRSETGEENNEHIQTKTIYSEENAETDKVLEENNKTVETNDDKNDLNEENDNGDKVFDKNNELFDINDKIHEKTYIRKSNRKRKPNKLYEEEIKMPGHSKFNFKTHQCYVCFKLYPTKEELIQHCQIHFDVCSLKTLTKCPICDFVTPKSLSAHLVQKHDIHLKIPFNHIKERNNSDGSKYCYNADGTIIEVIPSVEILNKNASMGIDKKNRERKDKSITKTKLVRKGKEWIVEKEDVDLKFDLLPQFDDEEYKKLKTSDNYIDRMKELYKLTKKKGLKMAFPCFDCDKICQNLSALKLHNRRHQIDPKPFRPRGEVKKEREKPKKVIRNLKNRNAKPKPIKNKHKCDDELKKFYETNIRGGDIEFWQFLKIFNKMDRENITEFEELQDRTDFGIHIYPKDLQKTKNNKPVVQNTLKTDVTATKNATNTKNNTHLTETSVKPVKIDLTAVRNTAVGTKNFKNKTSKPTYKRVIMISKEDYKKRIEAKNRLREKKISENV